MTLVPTARLAPLLETAIRDLTVFRGHRDVGAVRLLAERTGVSTRTLSAIRNGTRKTCYPDTADLLLCVLGRPDLWHVPADQGGFADLYETGQV